MFSRSAFCAFCAARVTPSPHIDLSSVWTFAAALLPIALGIVSSNPKTFIVGFLTFWYIALNDKGASPALDFADWFGKSTPSIVVAYAGAAVALLVLAQLFHTWELRRKW